MRGAITTLVVGILLVAAPAADVLGIDERRPSPRDIGEFVADPMPPAPSAHFEDFRITRDALDAILEQYLEVSEYEWGNAYSLVAFGDRPGHVILHDGRRINWMVRPGGLAWLEFPSTPARSIRARGGAAQNSFAIGSSSAG